MLKTRRSGNAVPFFGLAAFGTRWTLAIPSLENMTQASFVIREGCMKFLQARSTIARARVVSIVGRISEIESHAMNQVDKVSIWRMSTDRAIGKDPDCAPLTLSQRSLQKYIRARFKSLSILAISCETAVENAEAGDIGPCGCTGDGLLPAFGKAAASANPGKGPFDDPSSGQDFKTIGAI